MANNRIEFSSRVVNQLKQRAAFICSNPECHRLTIAPSKVDLEQVLYTGVVSHIHAASPGGPRYDGNLSKKECQSINNAIFLCASCSVMIDKNSGVDYSVEKLSQWKREHDDWVGKNLNKTQGRTLNALQVISHQQRGGITAGVVNIHNTQPQRHLFPELVNEIKASIKCSSQNIVHVNVVEHDDEAMKFAKEIHNLVSSEGYLLNTSEPNQIRESFFGIKYKANVDGSFSIFIGFHE